MEAAGDASSETKREFFEGKRKALADEVQQLVGQVPDGVELKFAVDSGRPQDCIVDYAQKYGIDCVVMGRRGLGAIRGAIGCVSYSVLRSVDLPVLIVK